jgi:ubiquinone/menaquinone biosynthesis C-methylase UbiE
MRVRASESLCVHSETMRGFRHSAEPARKGPPSPAGGDQRFPTGSDWHTWSELRSRYRDNDAVWLIYHVLNRVAVRASWAFQRRARDREAARDLPGLNTRELNQAAWNAYDWGNQGEEWTVSPEWRQSLIEDVILANMAEDAVALEIGPGGGRWSSALQEAASRLILADISESAIEACQKKFAGQENVAYHVTDGVTLTPLPDESVDFIWSFETFVHIAPVDQKAYMRELRRVMRPGARAAIHHATEQSRYDRAWRSSMTAPLFAKLVEGNGMKVIEQINHWGPRKHHAVPTPGDVITIFER